MSPKRYRLYLDESGDHTTRNLETVSKRYLGLTGVILPCSLDNLKAYHLLARLKNTHFPDVHPDDPVLFHREDIREGNGVFKRLKDNPDMRLAFNKDLLTVLTELECVIITVVIDKKNQIERYGERAFNPYEFSFVAILERYCGWLAYRQAEGDVFAEGRGKLQDTQLQEKYKVYCEQGSGFPALGVIQKTFCSPKIGFKGKEANVAGLQIADLIANPSKQQILIEKNIIADTRTDFGKELSKVFDVKYNKNYGTGEVWGYGKKFMDLKH